MRGIVFIYLPPNGITAALNEVHHGVGGRPLLRVKDDIDIALFPLGRAVKCT